MKDLDREELGKIVRWAWVEYCLEIHDTKPSHIAPWEELPEQDKEADRRIGEYVAGYIEEKIRERNYRPQCGYCGRFVPRSVVHKITDHYYGATGVAWDCPSCGETTSTL